MATDTMSHRSIGIAGIGIGAGLTIAFTLVADLLGATLRSAPVAVALAAIALFLAGLVTLRIRPTAHPLEPALGAGGIVLLFGIIRVALWRQEPLGVTPGQLGVALVMGVVMAFLLAWSGGSVGSRLRRSKPLSTGDA